MFLFKVGILRDKFMLVLEFEVVFIYCSWLLLFKLEGVGGMGVFEVGKKYLVFDVGGNLCLRNWNCVICSFLFCNELLLIKMYVCFKFV